MVDDGLVLHLLFSEGLPHFALHFLAHSSFHTGRCLLGGFLLRCLHFLQVPLVKLFLLLATHVQLVLQALPLQMPGSALTLQCTLGLFEGAPQAVLGVGGHLSFLLPHRSLLLQGEGRLVLQIPQA